MIALARRLVKSLVYRKQQHFLVFQVVDCSWSQ
jgi:hypothetical protein